MAATPDQAGTVYAYGQATPLANKDAFYQLVGKSAGYGTPEQVAQQFSNNPWGVSYQELLGSLGGPSASSGGGGGGGSSSNYYNQTIADLNSQIDKLNQREGATKGIAEDYYNTNKGTIQSGYDQGQTNLARSREKVDLNKSQSLRDLAQNIRNAYQSNQIQLGVGGAGDSSAQNMLKFALGRLQTQSRGGILNQTNEQYKDINLKADALQRDFNDKMAQLDQWKRQRIFEIADKFQTERDYLSQQKTAAARAMANQSAQNALAALKQVDTTHQSAVGQVQNDFAQLAQNFATNAGQTNYDVQGVDQNYYNPDAGITPQSVGAVQSVLPSIYKRRY